MSSSSEGEWEGGWRRVVRRVPAWRGGEREVLLLLLPEWWCLRGALRW